MRYLTALLDVSMLDKVKSEDRVKFRAENLGGTVTVTRIEPAK